MLTKEELNKIVWAYKARLDELEKAINQAHAAYDDSSSDGLYAISIARELLAENEQLKESMRNIQQTVPANLKIDNCLHCGAKAFLAWYGGKIYKGRCLNGNCGAVGGSSPDPQKAADLWNKRV